MLSSLKRLSAGLCSCSGGPAAPAMARNGWIRYRDHQGSPARLASCSDVLPDIGRMKACMQNKMGQLPK